MSMNKNTMMHNEPVKATDFVRRSGKKVAGKEKWSVPSTWSRKTMLLVSTAVTSVVFFVDSALQKDNMSTTIVAGLGSEFVFYAVGLVTAFVYLKLNPTFGKPKGKKVKSVETSEKPARAGASKNFQDGVYADIKKALLDGRAEAAQQLLLQAEAAGTADVGCYNLMVAYYARQGNEEKALHWLERIQEKGLQPEEKSFLPVLVAYKDNVRSMEACFEKMIASGVGVSGASYSLVIDAHVQQGNVRQAGMLLRRMKQGGLTPEPSLYNTLIHACGCRGLLSEAREVFSDMKANGIKLSVVTFTALIDASAKALDLTSAEHWINAMSEMGIEPNVVSYSTVISACAKVGDLSRAEFWFALMREKGVEPNAFSMSALINACAKVGDAEAACAWLKRAKDLNMAFDVVVYSCVINACAKVGDAERAMEVFQQMRADGIAANIVIYAALAKPYAYRGDFAEVERIAEMMEKEGIAMNDFFLYSLLLAYSRARPRPAERAEAAFVKAMQNGIRMNERIKKALASAVGYGRSEQLCRLH